MIILDRRSFNRTRQLVYLQVDTLIWRLAEGQRNRGGRRIGEVGAGRLFHTPMIVKIVHMVVLSLLALMFLQKMQNC